MIVGASTSNFTVESRTVLFTRSSQTPLLNSLLFYGEEQLSIISLIYQYSLWNGGSLCVCFGSTKNENVIQSPPKPAQFHIPPTGTSSAQPFLQLQRHNLWHLPPLIALNIKRDQQPFSLSFFDTTAYMLCKEGLCKRLPPLPQLWLTSESRSTCIRWFQGV